MWFNKIIAWIMGKIYGASFHRVYFGGDNKTANIFEVKRLIPKWASGQTIGESIFLKPHLLEDQHILRHEYTHVQQFRKLGMFFIPCYYWASIVAAKQFGFKKVYSMNKYEIQALNATKKTLNKEKK